MEPEITVAKDLISLSPWTEICSDANWD
jgi:hypothetical protein